MTTPSSRLQRRPGRTTSSTSWPSKPFKSFGHSSTTSCLRACYRYANRGKCRFVSRCRSVLPSCDAVVFPPVSRTAVAPIIEGGVIKDPLTWETSLTYRNMRVPNFTTAGIVSEPPSARYPFFRSHDCTRVGPRACFHSPRFG